MKKEIVALLGVLVAIVAFAPGVNASTGAVSVLSYLGQNGFPRGMRNNNPGNIRISSTAWRGKVPAAQNTDGAFEQFQTYAFGVRAMIKNLLTYGQRGLTTVRQIVSTWAPSTENDTNTYIRNVAAALGVSPDATLNLENQKTMQDLVWAMTAIENGRPAVTPEVFNYAWQIV